MTKIDRGRIAAFVLTAIAFLAFCGTPGAGAEESASYDVAGRWLIRGNGFGKKTVSVELKLEGLLDLQTKEIDGKRHISGYDLWMRIDASRLKIKAWQETYREELSIPMPLPELRPTLNSPLILPAVKTREGLIYQVTLTSVTSGTVKIYGTIDLDVVGKTEIDSNSKIWKEGTPPPDIEDLTKGCGVGLGVGPLLLLLPLLLSRARRR